ncbi:MAG: DNA polymerase III subunit delta [Thermovirgaceae bacterium]
MARLLVIDAKGPSQRRLLEESIAEYKEKGFAYDSRLEGSLWVDLLADSRSRGLFEAKRLVVVESAETMGNLQEPLVSLVETEEDSETVCILLYNEDPSRFFPKGLFRKLEVRRAEKIPLWTGARVSWMSKLSSEAGIFWSRDAMQLLAEWIDDPEELRSEMKKLEKAAGDEGVTEKLVRTLCLDEGGKQLLRLLDGVCQGRTGDVLSSLAGMREREEPLRIISALHKRMRFSMYSARYGRKEDMTKALGAKPYQMKQAQNAASRYSPEGLSRFVQDMIRASCLAKTTNVDTWNDIELAVLRLLREDAKRRTGTNRPAGREDFSGKRMA